MFDKNEINVVLFVARGTVESQKVVTTHCSNRADKLATMRPNHCGGDTVLMNFFFFIPVFAQSFKTESRRGRNTILNTTTESEPNTTTEPP